MNIKEANVMDMDDSKNYGRFVILSDGFSQCNKGQVIKIIGKDKYNYYYKDNYGCDRAVPQNDEELMYIEPRKHIDWALVEYKLKKFEY